MLGFREEVLTSDEMWAQTKHVVCRLHRCFEYEVRVSWLYLDP